MTTINRIAASLMAAALFTGASSLYAQSSNQSAQAQSSYTTPAQAPMEEWNTPPAGTEQAQQGWRDGVEAAKLDKLAHRPVDPKVSHLYVHPPANVKKDAVADYRAAFESGYKKAVDHSGGM